MENFKDVFNFVKETVAEINKPDLEKQKFMNENPNFNKAFSGFLEKKFPEETKKLMSEWGIKEYVIWSDDFITKLTLHWFKKIVETKWLEQWDIEQGKEARKALITGWKSPFISLLDSYKELYNTLDKNKFQEFFIQNWIELEDNNQNTENKEQPIDNKENQWRQSDDEEDLEDNKEYKLTDNMEQYISLLPMFTSVWYQKDPETWTTLCSRTAAQDAKKLYWLERKEWNAFDVMRAKDKKFKKSIVSDLYKEKEKSVDSAIDIVPKEDMWKSEYINNLAWDNNVIDLYVTSSTVKWKKYWHRATMFRIWDQWFVIDPYTALQPGEQKNKPRTLESYTKSMKEWNNKREFMRMDFYKSDVLDNKVTWIFKDNQDNKNTALA